MRLGTKQEPFHADVNCGFTGHIAVLSNRLFILFYERAYSIIISSEKIQHL